MGACVHILLNPASGDSQPALSDLGVEKDAVLACLLKGPPDVLIVVEADDWQEVEEFMALALYAVEGAIENLCLLLVQDGSGDKGTLVFSRN
jgi:hypothetical protein